MQTWIITGGNRGLGLQIARALAAEPDSDVVLAVRDRARGEAAAARIGPNVRVLELDLAERASVERFIERWNGPIAGLVNNAGIQIGNATRFTADGLEITFAVNHLHALRLSLGLRPQLAGGRLLFIGSGTHNPKHPTASRFGFVGERFGSIAECTAGIEAGDDYTQLGKDRYATSKFLSLVSAVELARRIPRDEILIACLDPGLMPGTNLASTAPWWMRFGWHYVLPLAVPLLPDASTTSRSGRAVAALLRLDADRFAHGRIYNYRLEPSRYAIDRVFDPEVGRRVIDDSLALLEAR